MNFRDGVRIEDLNLELMDLMFIFEVDEMVYWSLKDLLEEHDQEHTNKKASNKCLFL